MELFAEHGPKWNRVANGLADRTPLQCEALYQCNRSLISSNCAPNVLHLALSDRFDSSPALSRSKPANAASSRRRNNSSNNAANAAAAPAPASANRPKRKLEFEGSSSAAGPEDDEEARPAGSDSALPFKKRMGGEGSSNASSPAPTPRVVSRVKPAAAAAAAAAASAPVSSEQLFPLNRPVPASNLPPPELNHQLGNFLKTNGGQMFCLYEWFYSHLDRDYFALNEFSSLLAIKANFPLGNVPLLTRSEWAVVRRKLGRPRRLSPAFFASERAKLEAYREDVRSVRAGNAVVRPEVFFFFFFFFFSIVSFFDRKKHTHTGSWSGFFCCQGSFADWLSRCGVALDDKARSWWVGDAGRVWKVRDSV
jgi:hypothetical protein